ncbi:MAG: sugar phosphate isomerase/epimerase [Planctomycetes bacterium]|nr:sugar phosphate isomerase/epimerase [Planctomycetota bacterium]
MKRISIGSWAYTIGPYASNPVDFETVCAKLSALGFDGLELGGFPPHPNPDDLPNGDQRQAVIEQMESHNLAFSGLAANLWAEHLIDTDDSGPYIAEFTKNCVFARDLGIAGIRVDTVQPPTIFEKVDEATAFKRVTSTFRQCNEIAKDHGLYMTWEFEPGFAFNKPSDAVRMLDAVDDPNFGVLYDTSHGHMVSVVGSRQPGEREVLEGGQVEFIRMLRNRINHVHLIDSDNTCHKDENGEDETSMHLPFGQGVLDFEALIPELAKVELSHDWWTIDLCFWPDAWGATEICKNFMDQVNERYFEISAS